MIGLICPVKISPSHDNTTGLEKPISQQDAHRGGSVGDHLCGGVNVYAIGVSGNGQIDFGNDLRGHGLRFIAALADVSPIVGSKDISRAAA